jgi:hypothetical protein
MAMRRFVALFVSVVLVLSLAVSGATAAPKRENSFNGNFDVLDWDGTVVGHVTTSFREPTAQQVVPGTLDVTWVAGARFPFEQQPYGVDESHAQLVAAWFGHGNDPRTGATFKEWGVSGYICDYSAPWNAVCHDFSVVFQKDVNAKGNDLIGFADTMDPVNPWYDYDEWFQVGKGGFALHYVGPTGG